MGKIEKIIKRDGRVKDFDLRRIIEAVSNSYKDAYGTSEYNLLEQNEVCSIVYDKIKDRNMVSVEEIQNIIVEVLLEKNEYVSKYFSDYRNMRSTIRESKSNLIKNIEGLVNYTNTGHINSTNDKDIINENSNKQSYLASTQRDLIAGEVSKYIASTQMIPKHLIEAHEDGKIKIHDLDYFLQPIYNCELINLEDMLQNGTVINKKKINKPRSLRTAMTLATQIAAQVSSSTYGGQTMTLSHLAPFVRISREKIRRKYYKMCIPMSEFGSEEEYNEYLEEILHDNPNSKFDKRLEELIDEELKSEIKDAVQTFNYQISTLMTTNGQAPFISLCMYISENPEYELETAMLIEEFFKQRIEGMENEYGVKATQTFPKLLYFLDENNAYPGTQYYWLTELAAKSTSLRMNPDIISVKKMKEVIGYAFPPMGCRALLSPFKDKDGNVIFYGRGNLGVCTINLPHVALSSNKNMNKFWEILDERLELCRQVGEIRYDKLRGVKASVAPILWQHGAISRLNYNDDITKAIDERGFTVTLGYSGIYETVKYMTGVSHTNEKGFELAEQIMIHLKNKTEEWKKNQPHLRFALYGTPQESTTGWFNDKLVKRFGIIKDITDKGWITNSYHVDIREEIDAFSKLTLESKLQKYSTGGAISYVETYNMNKNISAILSLFKHMYENIIYAEINFESDVCGKCGYSGSMDNDPETLNWVCPNCGNSDQMTLSVVRRTCGYLGETFWSDGRKKDILNRVKHL